MLAITLRPSLLLTILALCFRPASASPIPDRNANFLFARSAAPDAHGLTGGQIVIIASVAILGIVCLVVAGIVGCYLCAKIEYQDRQRRREMQQEEQGLIVSDSGNVHTSDPTLTASSRTRIPWTACRARSRTRPSRARRRRTLVCLGALSTFRSPERSTRLAMTRETLRWRC